MCIRSHERDVATLVVPRIGRVAATDDPLEPYRLLDADGGVVVPVALFLRELLAASRAALTLRSYAMDLLRWWRFLAAVDVRWEQATPVEGRDFSLWIRQASKPRPGPGRGAGPAAAAGAGGADRRRRPQSRREGLAGGLPGQVNPVTGKPSPGRGMRRGRSTTARRCCGRSTTFTGKPEAGRWSTRSRWTGRGAAGVPTPITTRWIRGRGNGKDVTAARWRSGRRGRSRMRCSSCCSRRCPRTGTGRWWPSGSRPGPGPLSCSAPARGMPTRDSS